MKYIQKIKNDVNINLLVDLPGEIIMNIKAVWVSLGMAIMSLGLANLMLGITQDNPGFIIASVLFEVAAMVFFLAALTSPDNNS
jgi:hypothetical protein